MKKFGISALVRLAAALLVASTVFATSAAAQDHGQSESSERARHTRSHMQQLCETAGEIWLDTGDRTARCTMSRGIPQALLPYVQAEKLFFFDDAQNLQRVQFRVIGHDAPGLRMSGNQIALEVGGLFLNSINRVCSAPNAQRASTNEVRCVGESRHGQPIELALRVDGGQLVQDVTLLASTTAKRKR